MQQKALVTVFGLALVASIGFALTRMANPSGPAAQSAMSAPDDAAMGACPYSGKDMAAEDCGGCPSEKGTCDMEGTESIDGSKDQATETTDVSTEAATETPAATPDAAAEAPAGS